MRGDGANFNALYADDSDDDSDGFGCVFPKDGAGFDTDSDGSDFSNLADDLFEKASVDSFEFVPPSRAERASGSGYNRAKLDMDDDAVSVGSDTEFQRASKSNKRWNWVEADEESVGSDSDFEVQFEGRTNSVYDLKAGQGEVEDFLGGGGGEDLNEDFEFRTDFADTQRAEAFFNEGSEGVRGGGGRRGGELVETEYIPAKVGAARKRNVDPKFIAASAKKTAVDPDALIPAPKSTGKSKSAALVAAGLAQAQAKKGGKSRFNAKVETAVGKATEGELIPITRPGPAGEVEGAAPVEKLDEILDIEDAQARAESDAQAKARIDRSLEKLKTAFRKTTDEAGREKLEENLLSELEDIGGDVRKGIKAMQRRATETNKSRVQALLDSLLFIDARIEAGLSIAGMLQATRLMMNLEHEYFKLLPEIVKGKKAETKAVRRAEREEAADEGDVESETPQRPPAVVKGEQVVGPVALISLGSRKKALKFADSSVRIDNVIGLDKLEELLAEVKGADGDADAKKEIIKRLKRAISTKKLQTGQREKRKPTGFLKAKGGGGASVPKPAEPATGNNLGLTARQRRNRAK